MEPDTIDNPAETAAPEKVALAVGQFVIVRTSQAGVHAGSYQGHAGQEVTLTDSRRLWYWKAAKSISLSAVAQYGVNQKASKIAPAVANLTLLDAIEIIVVTDEGAKSIMEAPVVEAS